MIYDKLFEIQEYVKDKKGIKPKTKNVNIPAAVDGIETEGDKDKDKMPSMATP